MQESKNKSEDKTKKAKENTPPKVYLVSAGTHVERLPDHVVMRILWFCETKDLPKIVLIKRVWYRVSPDMWIKEYRVFFNKKFEVFDKDAKQLFIHGDARAQVKPYQKRSYPTNLIICGWEINELLGKWSFAKFWNKAGPKLEYLQLKDCQISDDTFKAMLQHAYNVKHLTLENVTFGGHTAPQKVGKWQSFLLKLTNCGSRQPRPQPRLESVEFIAGDGNCDFTEWYHLFYNCPNLKVIRIKAANYLMVVNLETHAIYLHLKTTRVTQPLNEVLSDIDADGVEYVWEGLKTMVSNFGIPLRKLKLGFGLPEHPVAHAHDGGVTFIVDQNIPAALFERMLRDCSDTLESLTCRTSYKYTDFDYSAFSENLTSLELFGDIFSTAEFLCNTPNLIKFRWHTKEDIIYESATDAYISRIQLGNLKVFLYETPTPCTYTAMYLIAEWCPRITKLGLSLNDDLFERATYEFPELLSLQIMRNSDLCSEDIVKFLDDELCRNQGILRFKHLEEFLMPHYIYGLLWRIDMPTFREALYELPNLSKMIMHKGSVCIKLLN